MKGHDQRVTLALGPHLPQPREGFPTETANLVDLGALGEERQRETEREIQVIKGEGLELPFLAPVTHLVQTLKESVLVLRAPRLPLPPDLFPFFLLGARRP